MVRAERLTKHYDTVEAVNGVSFDVAAGQVFGFIGPNGAGKTTTIRMLATLIDATAGEAWISGRSILNEPDRVRQLIGYMPDEYGVYDGLTAREYLSFFAAARRVARRQRTAVVEGVLDLTDLTPLADTQVSTLSKGTKQRLCLAQALVHDPAVLLLDEPAAGLDPRARIEFRAMLRELARMGKTIFISSHILTELSDVCTHVGVIERGRLLACGEVSAIARQFAPVRTIDITVADRAEEARTLLERCEHVLGVELGDSSQTSGDGAEQHGGVLRVRYDGPAEQAYELLKPLIEASVPILAFGEPREDLETLFMKIARGPIA